MLTYLNFHLKKFDFVISNGVAHHTKSPVKNLNICCKAVKNGGFFILGIGNKAGFFQRNLQRYILYSLSENKNDIVKYSKILFKSHLQRSVKFSGRDVYEIIYDTYVNPKIHTFGTNEILKIFSKNGLSLFSSYYDLKDLQNLGETNSDQFKSINNSKNQSKIEDNIFVSDFEDISLSNNKLNNSKLYKQFNSVVKHFNHITDEINNINFNKFNIDQNIFSKEIINYKKKLLSIDKINIINQKHNEKFFNEVLEIIKVLKNKKIQKNDKFLLIKKNYIQHKEFV